MSQNKYHEVYSVRSTSFSRLGIYLMTEAKPSLETLCVNRKRDNWKKSNICSSFCNPFSLW